MKKNIFIVALAVFGCFGVSVVNADEMRQTLINKKGEYIEVRSLFENKKVFDALVATVKQAGYSHYDSPPKGTKYDTHCEVKADEIFGQAGVVIECYRPVTHPQHAISLQDWVETPKWDYSQVMKTVEKIRKEHRCLFLLDGVVFHKISSPAVSGQKIDLALLRQICSK